MLSFAQVTALEQILREIKLAKSSASSIVTHEPLVKNSVDVISSKLKKAYNNLENFIALNK